MNIFLGIILFAVIEQLVAWLMEKILPPDSNWRHPVALSIAIVVLVLIAILLPNGNGIKINPPTPTLTAPLLFYQLTIQDRNNQLSIEGAEVTLTVAGKTPFRATTDNTGVATFKLPEEIVGETAVLNIITSNYPPYRLNVTVEQSQLPDLIRLEASSP